MRWSFSRISLLTAVLAYVSTHSANAQLATVAPATSAPGPIVAPSPSSAQPAMVAPGAVASAGALEREPWFPGYGGLWLAGQGTLVTPLGDAADGQQSSMTRSHLPGLGIGLEVGVLFLRQWGLLGHWGFAQHLTGTDSPDSASSSQLGFVGRYFVKPNPQTLYFDLGVSRNSFSTDLDLSTGSTTRTAASWDGRIGAGYVSLAHERRVAYGPFLTADFGRFSKIEQSSSASYEIPSGARAWHYVLIAGFSIAYYQPLEPLLGDVANPYDPDKDGFEGITDRCSNEKEDGLLPDPTDGCPTTDTDRDGVLNRLEHCPSAVEDRLPPEPADGCPTDDPDQDGIRGEADQCPLVKEDGLNPDPNDGCLSPDRDQDGIVNEKDSCPDKPETVNGIRDEDGCPDEGRVTVDVATHQIAISEKIFFKTNSTEITRASLALIGEVAGTLKHLPEAQLIEVAGHADRRGEDDSNVKLTQGRADSVRAALIDRGVEPSRLTAIGYGAYCPLVARDDAEAYEKNRRVEFRIVRVAGKPTGVQTACDLAKEKGIQGSDPNGQGAPAEAASVEDAVAPSERETRTAIAKSDASVLFPDYHGCPEGEPTLNRVVILAVKKQGAFWQAKVDGLVSSQANNVEDACFRNAEDRAKWRSLYGQTTTVTVTLSKTKSGFKVVLP